MPWRQAREQSRRNNQYGVTFGRLRSLVILAVTVAWTATCRSYLPRRNHDPWNPNWEPCGPKLRCTASISVPRPTQRMRRSKETDTLDSTDPARALRKDRRGNMVPGKLVDTRDQPYFLDPKTSHSTQAWTGTRWCISCFTSRAVTFTTPFGVSFEIDGQGQDLWE